MEQWLRKCRLKIEGSSEAYDLSALRVRFKVEQNNLQRPNAANITITNPAKATAEKIKKEGLKVELEAGYETGYGTLFKGQIIQKRFGRETVTDTYLNIIATGGDQAYNFSTVSKSLAAGHTLNDQVNVVLEALKPYGIVAGTINELSSKKMPRGRTLFGQARDILRTIAQSAGADWWIDNDKLHVVKHEKTLDGQAFVMNSRTGMIGMPVQTMDGIVVRCLLNARIRPGTRIKIDQSSIQEAQFSPNYQAAVANANFPSLADDGFYKVAYVDYIGDTHGGPWYNDIICIRADASEGNKGIPLGLVAQGIVIPE